MNISRGRIRCYACTKRPAVNLVVAIEDGAAGVAMACKKHSKHLDLIAVGILHEGLELFQ